MSAESPTQVLDDGRPALRCPAGHSHAESPPPSGARPSSGGRPSTGRSRRTRRTSTGHRQVVSGRRPTPARRRRLSGAWRAETDGDEVTRWVRRLGRRTPSPVVVARVAERPAPLAPQPPGVPRPPRGHVRWARRRRPPGVLVFGRTSPATTLHRASASVPLPTPRRTRPLRRYCHDRRHGPAPARRQEPTGWEQG